jgi:CTP:molybdopterin cytidylyltransferase MocA
MGMRTLDATLCERVDALIRSHKGSGAQPLLATTDTHSAIHELIARSEGLERAVREIALDVQRLEAAEERDAALTT